MRRRSATKWEGTCMSEGAYPESFRGSFHGLGLLFHRRRSGDNVCRAKVFPPGPRILRLRPSALHLQGKCSIGRIRDSLR